MKDSLELPPAEEDGYLPTVPEHLFTPEDYHNFTFEQAFILIIHLSHVAGVGQENPTQLNFAAAKSRGQSDVMCNFDN